MKELNKKELNLVMGGSILTAAFINAIVRGAEFIMDLGRRLGSSVRRIIKKSYC